MLYLLERSIFALSRWLDITAMTSTGKFREQLKRDYPMAGLPTQASTWRRTSISLLMAFLAKLKVK